MTGVYVEGATEIDLSAADWHEKFDVGKRPWKSVDFRAGIGEDHLWIEVKHANETQNAELAAEMRDKFLGTLGHTVLREEPLPPRTLRVVLLLEVDVLTPGQIESWNKLVQKAIQPDERWSPRVTVAVLDRNRWNRRFPRFPVSEPKSDRL